MALILFLSNIQKNYKVTNNNILSQVIVVYKADNTTQVVRPSKKWLLFSDV